MVFLGALFVGIPGPFCGHVTLMGFVKLRLLVGTAHSNRFCFPSGPGVDVCGNSWGVYTVGSFRSTGLWTLAFEKHGQVGKSGIRIRLVVWQW